ncbi:MAG: tripartite tricarboxylate transporter substrate binding protein [Rhodoplanes sp.]|uniref:Bug family tripartite tricarboxylate transporter substrate binding protein n=1 Tax=Rhodoplanes sp. TaxID=1968906 RepID=UPI00184651A0|nr:tripartite tricarboxylate transporter substrate binding protein [Rhodoplanes sp.]NVO13576.1 tripartite tricarboxylate transporter substrate binding protein [Rhodoplanes sp.]
MPWSSFSCRAAILGALAGAAATLLHGSGAAQAQPPSQPQEYPVKPIRLVVPYPPGALTDLLGRAVGERLSAALKQPVVIENKPGAGTLIGAEMVAKAVPDGYTLMMATSTTLGISPAMYKKSTIDPERDFAPIAQLGAVNFFLIARPDFPARTLKEAIATIQATPGQFNYGSVGNGSPHHLFMEALKKEYGLDIQHVPYKGIVAALPDLLSGKIDMAFADATAAIPNIEAGKVIGLGSSAATPTTLIAGVPPIAATVPGFDWQAWQGVVAPAGTPPAIVTLLSTELQRIQASSDFRALLVTFGMDPSPPNTPEEFAAIVKADRERWARAVEAFATKID